MFGFAAGTIEESNTIGISKIVSHPALDAVEQGIQDELDDLGYTDVEYDLQNANGDMNSAASIATKFRTDQVRVAVGIATPTSQALVQTIDNIPVVFTAVTDPVSAGLVESLENTPGNVTGYSDMTPVREQIEMMVELGGVQRLGHVYSSGEANAVTLANLAEEVCDVLDIEFVAATVTNSAEVRQATQSIVDRVDAIYVSTDNTVVSALNSLTSVALANNVPVVSADPSSAEEFDVLAAYGFDYYTMGRATGRLVARILDGEDPGSIPVQFLTDADDLILLLNLDVADSLGILVPDEVMERADKIVEDGQVRDN
jgi:putative ABC transport system substrate-binding protein